MGIDGRTRARRVSASNKARLQAVLLAAPFVTGACGSAPPPKTADPVSPTTGGVLDYLPLEDKTVFSYETRVEPSGELNVSSSAIELVTGGALLRAPLQEGASWRGDFGRVRLTRMSRTVTVPAGTFQKCLETVEEMTSAEGTKRTTTAYCPAVGITLRETEVEQDAQHAIERIELKSFGKRFSAGSGSE